MEGDPAKPWPLLCHLLLQHGVTLKDLLSVASLEVWVEKMTTGGQVCSRLVDVFIDWVDPLEAVEVELTDEAGEVGGFEGVGVAQCVGPRGQDLSLEEVRIDDDSLAFGVPEDGLFGRVVQQAPQFGEEVFRVDVDGERPFTNFHALSLKNWEQR